MKLLADRMLGTLAKWLRLLGFDTAFPEECDDSALLDNSKDEDRVLLTRDKELASRAQSRGISFLLLNAVDLKSQVEQVLSELNLGVQHPLTRCAACNAELDDVEKCAARKDLPESVYFSHDEFWHCRICRKYYWEGSHWDNMAAFVDCLKTN